MFLCRILLPEKTELSITVVLAHTKSCCVFSFIVSPLMFCFVFSSVFETASYINSTCHTFVLQKKMRYIAVFIAVALFVSLTSSAALPPLYVNGNELVWLLDNGQTYQVQLRGVDVVSALYSCVTNTAIFDGPVNASYLSALSSWDVDIVRIPINQDCWLGADYIDPQFSGSAYQSAVTQYVQDLVNSGFYVIFDLHWVRGGNARAIQEQPMPDQNTPAFWQSVAATFSSMSGNVIFDLYNEPFPDGNAVDSPAAWNCWKNGGTACSGLNYTAVGMQYLVETVRAAGASNILMAGGISYSNDLDSWIAYELYDPQSRLAASWHSYNFNSCNNAVCWDLTIAPVISSVPVIVGEIGENDCAGGYISPLMSWLDSKVTSYLGWVFMPFNCDSGPALISDYSGTCTNSYGCTYQAHIRQSDSLRKKLAKLGEDRVVMTFDPKWKAVKSRK